MMIELLLASLLSVPACAGPTASVPSGAAAPRIAVPALGLQFAPGDPGQLYRLDAGLETRLSRSVIWSDSKAEAFHLGPDQVLKLYTAPRTLEVEQAAADAKAKEAGRREAELLGQWASEGLSLGVRSTGEAEDGTFYAVMEKPKRGASGKNLIKKGRWEEIKGKMEELARRLSDKGWELGTLNPTQVYVERRGQQRALLIKAYSYDKKLEAPAPEALAAHYAARHGLFAALSSSYPRLREKDATLSAGAPTTELPAITLLVFEALRSGRTIKIMYRSGRGEPKLFHALPLRDSLKDDDFLKGYFRAVLFPERGGDSQAYTFRLDRIVSAEFLPT